ncbi:NUDIX hydrolase [Actinomycetospora termitidis]|uniref:NUDIX hydrolase n=1 Tax=Actinomycetospora termitidis TaxID=3053470 RepID=A0ABT7MEB8_9PSEU|nr:NUDIX hydrolase [Actinomycetospora sp. Odt1-22]MDL5158534.1 NUDIX hydrolase [Actinomycetospora sp. Odt1-22]
MWGARTTAAADADDASIRVDLHDVTAPEGDRFDYPVVHLPSVGVALVVRDEHVLMLRTYRYPVNRYGWELPGGGVDDGEDPGVAAAREAAEETGWRPVGEGRPLIAFEPLPGGVVTRVHVHLWTDAEPTDEPLDRHEPGRAQWVAVDDVVRLAAAGDLLGSGTLVGLLQYVAETDASRPRRNY